LRDVAFAREPLKYGQNRNTVEVDSRSELFREDAGNVVRKSAAGDMRQAFHCFGFADRAETRLNVNPGGREDRIAEALLRRKGSRIRPRETGFFDHLAHQGIAIGMHPGRTNPNDQVALRDVRAREESIAFDHTDGEAGQIIIVAVIDPGHLRSFAANQSATRLAASNTNTGNDRRADFRLKFAASIIIEEEKRLGTLYDQVIDAHCDQVDSNRVVTPGFDRDLKLGTNAVGCRDQNGVAVADAFKVKDPAKSADFSICAGAGCRSNQGFDELHHPVAGIDINTSLRVSETARFFCHHGSSLAPGSYVGIASRAMVTAPLYSTEGIGVFPALGAGPLPRAGTALSIPNLITLGRILLVPIVVWAIASGEEYIWIAFMLFLAAGVSDAVDGYLAKRFHMTTELGAYLDPLADKALIVSIYLTLGIKGLIPGWLVILVVSRDIMIIGAVMLSWLIGSPIKVKPLLVSKLNTVAQIVYACVVLGTVGFGYPLPTVTWVLMALVAILTLLSVAAYVAEWVRHINSTAAKP
jgi:cardiolipin synthase (CMP-forming)